MINTIIDGIAGIFLPIVSLLSAAGILKGIIAVLIATDVLIKESDNYLVLNAMADSLFYFLPMLLAYTSAKKFGANPFTAVVIAGIFLYPSLNHILESGQTVEFFHIPLKGVTYHSSVIPIILASALLTFVEKFLNKIFPDMVKGFLTPLLCIIFVGFVTLFLFGPIGMVNLDEYDRLSPQKLPLLKNLMQMKKLDFRKSHRSSYSHLPRMASFIGTSNRKALLTDPSGSRRYFFAEVKEKIDCSPLEHKQLFAQLKAELDEGKRYWFSAAEESELKLRNQAYYALPTEAEMILHCFRLPDKGEDFKLYSAVCLFNILLKRYPAAMRGITINKMGRIMNSLGAERMHTTTGNMYKLVALAG